jgi:hypothetical protein
MVLETILPIAFIVILFGLMKSTDNILNLRQHKRDQGEDTKTYL